MPFPSSLLYDLVKDVITATELIMMELIHDWTNMS
jgi:hypothetical protein